MTICSGTEKNYLWINKISYLCRLRGVDGEVQGELPSECEPCIAVWRFLTAFNKLIVLLLKLCLKDCNTNLVSQGVYDNNVSRQYSLKCNCLAFLLNQCYGKVHLRQAALMLEKFQMTQKSFVRLPLPVKIRNTVNVGFLFFLNRLGFYLNKKIELFFLTRLR